MSPALPAAVARVASGLRRARPSAFPWSAPSWPGGLERPAPRRQVGVDYDTDWSRGYPARFVRAVVLDNVTRPLTHVLATPTVVGAELLGLVEPPAIFVANHSSHLDTPVLLSVLPPHVRHRTAVAAAADTFFDRRWKAHLWALALAALPIERHRVNRRSADAAADLLEDGWNLVIYPEGGRSEDGWFQEFRGGAAYLATRTGRPVVPVHLEGTYRMLPKGGDRLRRHPTRVTFGSPLSLDEGEDTRRFGARIEKALAVLADEARSDWWAARRRAAASATPSPRGPDAAPWRRAWALGPTNGEDGREPGAAAGTGHDPRWAMRRR